jgi:dihydroorotate dehydrogenase
MSKTKTNQSLPTTLYKKLVRPALFSTFRDPEAAHKAAMPFLRHDFPSSLISNYLDLGKDRLQVNLNNLVLLDGPIGLAAGFDKDARMLPGLANIFDYSTIGTMLPHEWPGNRLTNPEVPGSRRIARLEGEEGMLNCLGFPFGGLDPALKNLSKYESSYKGGVDRPKPLNASVAVRPPPEGKGLSDSIRQFQTMIWQLGAYSHFTILMYEPNFASPNTKGLAVFFQNGVFEELAGTLIDDYRLRNTLKFLKMPPHLDGATRERNLDVAQRWMKAGGHGITAINTVRTEDQRLSMGGGGKSGRPIFDIMMANLRDYRKALGPKPIINAVGGIDSENVPDVLIDGGADTVQVFTPFIYSGPTYVRDAKVALLKRLDAMGAKSFEEVRLSRIGSMAQKE